VSSRHSSAPYNVSGYDAATYKLQDCDYYEYNQSVINIT